jgi:aerobic-type carbon monoxide dehydrogenase small subunit (CoxS/CutS family)
MADSIEFEVNGVRRTVDTDPLRPLLHVLREDLELTAAKYGCGEGQCGACTVLIDGKPTRSCIAAVETVKGKKVTTLEGLAPAGGKLHPLQQAFIDANAMQCAFCTAGMIVQASALLSSRPNPDEAEIVEHMNGNLCRCCCYPSIVAAIRRAGAK